MAIGRVKRQIFRSAIDMFRDDKAGLIQKREKSGGRGREPDLQTMLTQDRDFRNPPELDTSRVILGQLFEAELHIFCRYRRPSWNFAPFLSSNLTFVPS